MGCIILSSVICLALSYFFTLSHKWHDFQENLIKHKMNVLIFSTTFVQNISHSKKWVSEMLSQMYIRNHVNYLLFLSDFNETWIFLEFWKIHILFLESHAVRVELFNADTWIDRQPWWNQESLFAILQTHLKALHGAYKVKLYILYDCSININYTSQHDFAVK
jgi:hypothetical protein